MGRVNVWNQVSSLHPDILSTTRSLCLIISGLKIQPQCAIRLVGYTIHEVMGKNLVEEFITKEYRAAVSSVLDKALKGTETA